MEKEILLEKLELEPITEMELSLINGGESLKTYVKVGAYFAGYQVACTVDFYKGVWSGLFD